MSSALARRYRDFGTAQPDAGPPVALPENEVEDLQLAAFESGYQAGWEDALTAQRDGAEETAVAVAQNLHELSLSHRDAYLGLSAAMRPLLEQIVDKLLPEVGTRALGAHLLTQISQLMDDQAERTFCIAVAPQAESDIRALLNDMLRAPFTLTADPLLCDGQAYLRVADTECEINLKAVISGIGEALDAFYDEVKQEISDG